MKTFADRASAIMKKYPNHKRSTVDHDSMIDELKVLSQEQEQEKQARMPQEQQEQPMAGQTQFATGGYADTDPIKGLSMRDARMIQRLSEYSQAEMSKGLGGSQTGRDKVKSLLSAGPIDERADWEALLEKIQRSDIPDNQKDQVFELYNKYSGKDPYDRVFFDEPTKAPEIGVGGDKDKEYIDSLSLQKERDIQDGVTGQSAGLAPLESDYTDRLFMENQLESSAPDLATTPYDQRKSPEDNIGPIRNDMVPTNNDSSLFDGSYTDSIFNNSNTKTAADFTTTDLPDTSLYTPPQEAPKIKGVPSEGTPPGPGEPGYSDIVPQSGYEAGQGRYSTVKDPDSGGESTTGTTDTVEDIIEDPNSEIESKTETDEDFAIRQASKIPDRTAIIPTEEYKEREDTVYDEKTGTYTQGKKGFFGKIGQSMKDNPEDYYNVLAGLTPAITNFRNLKDVRDPSRVTPKAYRPSIKPTWFDSLPIEERIQQGTASSVYGLGERGTDADSYIKGLRMINQDAQSNLGLNMMEGQKLNMAEQRRIDTLLSDANKYNTGNENQANIDFHQEVLDTDQLKRDYVAGIGDNVGGIFKDIADSKLAKKVGEQAEKLAKINGVNTGTTAT